MAFALVLIFSSWMCHLLKYEYLFSLDINNDKLCKKEKKKKKTLYK